LAITGLLPTPGRIIQGEILFTPEGKSTVDLLQVNEAKRRSYGGGAIAKIEQAANNYEVYLRDFSWVWQKPRALSDNLSVGTAWNMARKPRRFRLMNAIILFFMLCSYSKLNLL
jgi:hypothetical protein